MELRALAEEQAALLRVAELVASAAPAQELFAAVATEAALLLNGEAMTLTRFDEKREMLVEATHHGPASIGTRIAFEADTLPDGRNTAPSRGSMTTPMRKTLIWRSSSA